MVWHAAVKLAYDGRAFMGSQRQPGERTVEGETIEALARIGAITSPAESRFRFASRTDRGVSALGNVAAFCTDFEQGALLRALNAASEDLFFFAWAEVPDSFTPRRARGRWYRYLLPAEGLDLGRVRECAALFEGRHDFKRFCKPDGRSTMKTVTSVEVRQQDGLLVVDLRAREFLRNMVRRTVAAMSEVGKGRASLEEVRAALNGEDTSFGLAPAEQLTLMDIEYAFDFVMETPPTLSRKVAAYQLDARSRLALVDGLVTRIGSL